MADYPQSKATFDHVIGQAPSQGGLVNLARRNTVAHIVGTARSGAGGILRLLAFAFASIQQAKAWGTDLEYLLRETLTLRDFQHGTVEVRIKELNPRTFILDNPEEAIEIVPVGSGQTEVRQFQVTGAQLANFLAASQDTANTHNIGQRDLFIQQQQRADLGQNGTTG